MTSEKLLTLKQNGHISEAVFNKIRSRHKHPPRIYGLPKFHKPETTLGKTVSGVNTFAYDMSAFLANILSPLTSNSNSTVKNSADLSLNIAREKVQAHEIVLSLDEASLFTNVPIDGDVQAALWKLESDADDATSDQIADLLDKIYVLPVNGSIYKQRDGTAIGSPISAVIANLEIS